MCVIVLPMKVVGPFPTTDAARSYLNKLFGSEEEATYNLTWAIKPLETPCD